ncbi:MAG: hypothetical protein LQ344_003378 [Seirophora lacunosa]|nr:MAG: hypothetical protein LQ344_003378 [Seirophora lacunosa]
MKADDSVTPPQTYRQPREFNKVVQCYPSRPSYVSTVAVNTLGNVGLWVTAAKAMTKISTAVTPPSIQLGLRPQSSVKPLPTSTVGLEKGLRRYTKSGAGEETPEIRILAVNLEEFLQQLVNV